MANIKIPTPLRNLTDNLTSVEIDGNKVFEIIDNLENKFPGVKSKIMTDGELKHFVNIYINIMKPVVGICSYIIDINGNCKCGTCNGKCVINNNYSEMIIKCGGIPIIFPITNNKEILNEICN